MKKIDLGKIIEVRGLDNTEVASLLFPKNKHSKMALKRVIAGEGVLDADQISRFSMYTGIPISELYEGAGWHSTIEGHTHILVSGDYTAKLNTQTWTTQLYHNDSLFHEEVLTDPSITLAEYIRTLEQLIENYD